MPRLKSCKASDCGVRYERLPEHPPFRNWCSDDCAISIARGKQDKARQKQIAKWSRGVKQKEKANRKAKRELDRKSLPWQHKHTQKAFNRMRVLEELRWFELEGREPECISCGKTNMDWCCGHLKTVGAQGGLRYDRMNTYLQCNRYCNMGLSGNLSGNKTTRGYLQGLRDRFGDAMADHITKYCAMNNAPVKWEWQQLEEMRAGFNQVIRQLERGSNG